MKKIVLVLGISTFIVSIVSAQKNSVILRGGINLANVSVTSNGKIDKANELVSFHAGLTGDINIAEILWFQPGILVTGKGSKTQSGNETDPTYYSATSNPIYIELPANLVLKFPIGKGLHLFAGAGPYLAMGIAGKNKTSGKVLGTAFKSNSEIKWSNDDPTTMNYEEGSGFGIMKRFDYGLNGTGGIEFPNAVLSVNYGYGLAKLQSGSNSSSNDANKHRVIGISIGFKL